jgi:hypothetical protein
MSRKGRCIICGVAGKLTEDHVPPQLVVPETDIEIRRLADVLSTRDPRHPGVPGRNAPTFPTLCAECNNIRLGAQTDPALRDFVDAFRSWVNGAFQLGLTLPPAARVSLRPALVTRAVFGHLLAAEGARESRTDMVGGTLNDAMRRYFLGTEPELDPSMTLLVWPYPTSTIVIGRGIGHHDTRYREPFVMDVLKFFPVAFGVVATEDLPAIPPLTRILTAGLTRLDDERTIEVPLRDVPDVAWPERPVGPSVVLMHHGRVLTIDRRRAAP